MPIEGRIPLSKAHIDGVRARGPVLVHKLESPIRDGNAEFVDEISFREPTAGDIYMWGNPVKRVDGTRSPWQIDRDEEVYLHMMSALSNIPLVGLLTMTPTDFVTCEAQLDRFFIPGFKTRISETGKEKSSPQQEPPVA